MAPLSEAPSRTDATARARGRLKIFLGYAPRVGKTFRMLDEARRRKERGEDVVVAAHQPEPTAEVRALLGQLEVIPELRTSLGLALHMDAILRRRPQVCVVDPLAQNNPAGFPNARRWQDIEQLLEKGISVLTAVNLLYVEEYRERVAELTGRNTKETVPREFLSRADEIAVVDVPIEQVAPEAPEGAQPATGDDARVLSELREMTLLLAAEVVEGQLEDFLAARGLHSGWMTQERILVCLTPRANAEAILASGLRNKQRFHGELHVIYVSQAAPSKSEMKRLMEWLERASSQGAHAQILEGGDPVETILDYARQHRITQIFIGQSKRGLWWSRIWKNPLDRLLRAADSMDVRVFPQ